MNELVKTLLTKFAARPTGSRVLGGVNEKSDWDYYTVESWNLDRWLRENGFYEYDSEQGQYEAMSWRHRSFPINVISCNADYYHAFDYAAQSAASAVANGDEEATSFTTRAGRVAFFKSRLREWHRDFDSSPKIEKRDPVA